MLARRSAQAVGGRASTTTPCLGVESSGGSREARHDAPGLPLPAADAVADPASGPHVGDCHDAKIECVRRRVRAGRNAVLSTRRRGCRLPNAENHRVFGPSRPLETVFSEIFCHLGGIPVAFFGKAAKNIASTSSDGRWFFSQELAWRVLSMAKAAAKKALSKSQILANIAEATGLSKKDVAAVIEALGGEIKKALGARGPGVFAMAGLVKIEKKKVPAKAARKNVADPFHPGEFRDYPAKPASVKVKVRALKALKAMV
jgi:hypothetical protein